ncbi:hypothetical protein D9M72_524170 [compost metagenome]
MMRVSTEITNQAAVRVSAVATSQRYDGQPKRKIMPSAIQSHTIRKSQRSRRMKAMMTRSRSGLPLIRRARASTSGSIRFASAPQIR